MQKTLIVTVTHRGLSDETQECIARTKCPSKIKVKGLSNLPRARSIGYDQALAAVEGTDIDTILSIDDDMVFRPESAKRVVEFSRTTGELVAGVALTQEGKLAARPYSPGTLRTGRWLTGLAFLAAPVALLRKVAETLPRLGGIREWCHEGEHEAFPGEWIGEDLWFCLRFGGVILCAEPVGHLKTLPIWPDEATIANLVHENTGLQ